MRTIETTLYQFDELSDEAKDRARDWVRAWIGDGDWFDSIYEDAERIYLRITSFDLGNSKRITGEFIRTAEDTARAILGEHGPDCDTSKLAEEYLLSEDGDDAEFLPTLLQEYHSMLNREWKHMHSDEYLDDFLAANEYEFNAEGWKA